MRLVLSPSGEAPGNGRQLRRFVGPAAVADATFRRIGAGGEQTAAGNASVWGRRVEIRWRSRGRRRETNRYRDCERAEKMNCGDALRTAKSVQ
jgi:hypothetical protein